jgi:glyoxylase-like metal-dependent hydrolase (beta-lactamase superfamily II)
VGDLHYTALGDGIYCIETGLYRHGLAACYLVREGDRAAFVDTGTTHTVPHLLAILGELGLPPANVDYVIPTHVHLDHAGGAGELMRRCPNATLVTHPKGAPHLIEPSRLTAGASEVYGAEAFARDFGALVPVPAERVIAAEDGHVINLNGRPLVFVDTPGHANHHGCIYDERSRGFFTGDTFGISYREFDTAAGPFLFAPTTPVAFDPEAWLQSVDKLMARQPQAMYLTHYCRVESPERLVDDLRHSIRALADLALAEEGAAEAGREDRLRVAVADLLVADVRAHGCTLDEGTVRGLLAVDTALNAQGLEVWLRRRGRRAAAAS